MGDVILARPEAKDGDGLVVSMHSWIDESTIRSLLGSRAFLSDADAWLFWFDCYRHVCFLLLGAEFVAVSSLLQAQVSPETLCGTPHKLKNMLTCKVAHCHT